MKRDTLSHLQVKRGCLGIFRPCKTHGRLIHAETAHATHKQYGTHRSYSVLITTLPGTKPDFANSLTMRYREGSVGTVIVAHYKFLTRSEKSALHTHALAFVLRPTC